MSYDRRLESDKGIMAYIRHRGGRKQALVIAKETVTLDEPLMIEGDMTIVRGMEITRGRQLETIIEKGTEITEGRHIFSRDEYARVEGSELYLEKL